MTDENSRALPAHCYRDPAEVVERQQLNELGCRACSSHAVLYDRVLCCDPRKLDNKGVPHIGHKCKWFVLRG